MDMETRHRGGSRTIGVVVAAALCVALIGGAGLVGCSQSSKSTAGAPKAIGQYVTAVQAYNSGNRDRAVSSLLAATRANPDLIMARVMLGDLYPRTRGRPPCRDHRSR